MKRYQRMLLAASSVVFAGLTVVFGASYLKEKRAHNRTAQTLAAMKTIGGKNGTVYQPVDVDYHYELAGQKILLKDNTYGEIWLPVLADVPLSTHPNERLKMDEIGRMQSYDENGSKNALTGIDISAHNNVTDWNAVKASGVDFVMLRVGYRTYGGGELHADDKFSQYYADAKAAGLKIGAYFFSQAISKEEAEEEAVFAAKQLDGLSLDYPMVYDWEIIFDDADGARTDAVSVETLTDATLTFCTNIKAFGYTPMIYQNKRTSLLKYDLPRLKEYPFWLAEYGDGPTYIYEYDMWQYSCKGAVDGIVGDVDMDLSFYDYALGVRQEIVTG